MLTIFTIPKAFEGHIGIIQKNAIHSWTLLHPDIEVVLCGDDPGVAEVAREYEALHIPYIARNEYGTPMLRSAFSEVLSQARHPIYCYVNADIMLMSDFVHATQTVDLTSYMIIGQRWNLDITELLDFSSDQWERELRRQVELEAELNVAEGMDYFVFPRQTLRRLLEDMPDFAVGRPWWDTWMVYHTRRLGLPVVDATPSVFAIHQNHGYRHVPERRENKWHGPEGDHNKRIAGGGDADNLPHFGVKDATHIIKENVPQRALGDEYLIKRVKRLRVLREEGRHTLSRHLLVRVLHLGFRMRQFLPDPSWRHFFYRITV